MVLLMTRFQQAVRDGIAPSQQTRASGTYPGYKTFSLTMGLKSNPVTKCFIDFIRFPDRTTIKNYYGQLAVVE
jgi:hypothetical protein